MGLIQLDYVSIRNLSIPPARIGMRGVMRRDALLLVVGVVAATAADGRRPLGPLAVAGGFRDPFSPFSIFQFPLILWKWQKEIYLAAASHTSRGGWSACGW